MLTIAVTGGVGSGKSSIIKGLQANSKLAAALFLNVDSFVHEQYQEPSFVQQVVKLFQTADRKALAKIIFNYPFKRKQLEFISAADIISKLEIKLKQASDSNVAIAIVEVPLLYELGLQSLFDKVICVGAFDSLRLERIMQRDNRSLQDAMTLIKNQMPQHIKMELADRAVVNNSQDTSQFEMLIESLANWIIANEGA
jgi:dephospho-CoA kinase